MIIRALDLETTGLEPSDEVVELGYYDLIGTTEIATAGGTQSLVRPARSIPPSASAVHHLTDEHVKDAPPWADTWRLLVDSPDDGEDLIFAAHMASYERQYLDPLIKARWIDTWRCSLRQWPDLDGHKLQELRYSLALPVDPTLAMPPHRALPDAYVCAVLLIELLKHQTVNTMLTWSDEPPLFTKFDFGNRYKGQPLSAADDGYLDWLANKEHSMGDDWRWNAKREIDRRARAIEEKAAADRKTYMQAALEALPGAATVEDLNNWFLGQTGAFAIHRILVGTDEYDDLIAACKARKQILIDAGHPQFEPRRAAS
jgi:exodeoxyribonuclease X